MPRKRLSKEESSPLTVKKHAGRFVNRPPATTPVGELPPPPDRLTARQKQIWRELATSAPRQLGASDQFLFERLVRLEEQSRTNTLAAALSASYLACLKALGFVPDVRKEKGADKPAPSVFDLLKKGA